MLVISEMTATYKEGRGRSVHFNSLFWPLYFKNKDLKADDSTYCIYRK